MPDSPIPKNKIMGLKRDFTPSLNENPSPDIITSKLSFFITFTLHTFLNCLTAIKVQFGCS